MLILKSSFKYDLEARNAAPRTVSGYLLSLDRFTVWCASQDLKLSDLTRSHIKSWLTHELTRLAPKSVVHHFNGVRAFFRWAVAEGEVTTDPCVGVRQPACPEKVVEVPEQGDIRDLLRTTGADFTGVRDATIITVLVDTGLRCSELIGLRLCDVDLENASLKVMGKFRRERVVPLGRKAVGQVAKYLRMRSRHPQSHLESLWLGDKGMALTDSGVRQMLTRKSKKAGIGHVHPHQFRRFFCVSWLSEGGSESGLMTVAGWRGTQMIRHYAGNKNATLAAKEHKRLSPGDRL